MKCLGRAAILVALVLLSLTSARAQGGGLTAVPKRKFNHRAEIVSVYDKATDRTSVVLEWYRVSEEAKEPVLFSRAAPTEIKVRAGFSYPGQVMTAPTTALRLDIGTDHEGESFFKGKEMPELIALIDGEQISLGKTVLERSKTTVGVVRPGQTTIERLSAAFTYQGLLRLVGAKKVVMKAGRLEFELKERHLEALRDLASRMVP